MPSPVESAIRNVVTKGIMGIANFNNRHRNRDAGNPFLEGIHTPLSQEHTLTDLNVTGQIPEGLNGLYVRNGPNPVKPPNPGAYHWFTGDAMLHGVRIRDGKALWYRNRWIRSSAVSKALGEADAPGPRNFPQDNANTNIVGHAGRLWAIVEAGGFPVEMSDELETRAHNPFDGTLDKAFSAHPHLDPETGELHAICYFGREPTTIWHTVVGRDGKVRRNEPVPVRDGPSIHDCMITKSYVIIMDLPVTFSMKALMAGQRFPYAWNPQHPARIGLMPREGKADDIIWCEVEPCYIFHVANAYEAADGKVIMDAAVHATMFATSTMGPDSNQLTFERLTIDPSTRRVAREVIDADGQEFPRPDERRIGKPYRYAYTVAFPQGGSSEFFSESRLYKHDLETRTRQVLEFGEGRMPGEFVFVPRRADSGEDDGWLLGYVLDTNTRTTDLVILDAANFTAPPQAIITIPHRVPPGFHGNFIAMD
jgi:8'-apo-carotenoid 13,14-cleaving dioxygenase